VTISPLFYLSYKIRESKKCLLFFDYTQISWHVMSAMLIPSNFDPILKKVVSGICAGHCFFTLFVYSGFYMCYALAKKKKCVYTKFVLYLILFR
jgi:hypothetical protein